jgi:hypothetical protein
MELFETQEGSEIVAARLLDSDEVELLTSDGVVTLNVWQDSVVGGMARVQLQDVPEIFKSPGEWYTPRRES